jgi:hypothetical protein
MVIQLFEHVCTCIDIFDTLQFIDLHITYLWCEYKLIWTSNEWLIGILILANQNNEHMHAHACWNIYVYHYIIDVYLSYLWCEFQLIWAFNVNDLQPIK